ncbi:MAG TPA: OmpA family protein [Solirubrobacteraceae bacterium]|nr:OmpA family protein [Solirubrobacteraceae bacterium]
MFHWASTAVVATAALSFPSVPIDAPVTSIDGSMVITRARVTLQSDVLFAFDSATLNARARERIGEAAQAIAQRRPRSVVVEGYTDSRGSTAYNLRLSQRRAEAVRQALTGITARAVGRGEAAPVASNATTHGRSLNRRVEIRFR